MTENEALEIAIHCLGVQAEQEVCEECPVYRESGLACRETARNAITALKEIQQYREIGTVEECRDAVEKQKPKRKIPVTSGKFYDLGFMDKCPNCGSAIKIDNIYHYDVCKICGQRISNEESEDE